MRNILISLIALIVAGCAPAVAIHSTECDEWTPEEIKGSDSKAEQLEKLKRNTYMQGVCSQRGNK